MSPTPAQRAQAARIAAELAEIGFVLPGTLTERPMRCGHPNCRCHADPPALHGPYHQWTRKVNGKTVTRFFTDDQVADYSDWFDNQRRLRQLIGQLEALSLAIVEADPRWNKRRRADPRDAGHTTT
ncbi:MAG: DUF6788 family protein [Micromonosporaceae bacterium]